MMPNIKYQIPNTKKGFTLIEATTVLFIFSLISLTFYQVMDLGIQYIQTSKNRLGAVAIANERMEIARNLNYDDVGIRDGACAGNLPQDEDVTEGGKKYHIHTLAAYVDDPFDGTLGGSPNDAAYKDYKVLTITVSWSGGSSGSVSLSSRFVPPGLEAATSGDGILSINVFSDQASEPVAGSTVRIRNPLLGFSETRQTDSSGNVMIVGARESIQKYEIGLSKDGYESVTTLPPFPDSDFNPVDVDASVVAGSLNVVNIVQNKTADLSISSVDPSDNPVAGISYTLSGGRVIGNGVTIPYDPIYNFSDSSSTGDDGKKQYGDLGPGQYTLTFSDTNSDYELVGTEPASPFSLNSEENLDLKVLVADKSATSVLFRIKNADGTPLAGAAVNLKNTSGYDQTLVTDENGAVLFMAGSGSFDPGAYDYKVTADGYGDETGQVTVEDGKLADQTVTMNLAN